MNMFKSNGGFTLVELIVVIAILAILAGIAVPAYSGYIAKAQTAADLQLLSSVNTAVQGLAAADGIEITKIEVNANGGISVTPSGKVSDTEVNELLGGALSAADFSKSFNGATWENNEWKVTTK